MRAKEQCDAIESSIREERPQEALSQAQSLVQIYPGHLRGLFLLAACWLHLDDPRQARLNLDTALGLDPENAECRMALAECFRRLGEAEQATRQFVRAFALVPSQSDVSLVVGEETQALADLRTQGQASALGRAIRFKLSVNWGRALPEFQNITRSDPFLPEAWLGLAESFWRLDRSDEAISTLDQISVAWPNFVKAKLISGDILLRKGQVEAGTAQLHAAQILDPSGAVAERTLNQSGYYSHLWVIGSSRTAPSATLTPKAVTVHEAEAGEAAEPSSASEPVAVASPTMRQISLELSRLADQLTATEEPSESHSQTPTSALVILTCRKSLEEKFGAAFVERLTEQTRRLIQAIGMSDDRAIHFVALDDPEQMSGLGGIAASDPADAAQVKAAIDSLADGLLTQGNDLRHLLILGGDDIVPFYRVSNPTEDQDEDIYTDVPYSARNGSYLLPTRAVGRLPDGDDPNYLLRVLDRAAQAHATSQPQPVQGLKAFGRFWKREKVAETTLDGFGYTASVWKEAARKVFESIGEAKQLRMSPPISHKEFSALVVSRPTLSYFNLHGVEGEPAWYGQRDRDFAADYPLFPVALLPEAITHGRVAGTTVFTEACYGVDVLGRTEGDSIALKFLAEGARGVVGSTRLAYGSLTLPLAGADLLGQFFWAAVLGGMPIGQALQWAKLSFASDAMNRQGYLDSEDQKTLLTFNLFGDPTLPIEGQSPAWDKLQASAVVCKSPLVSCSHGCHAVALPELPSDMVNRVQSQVSHRVPWLTTKQVKVMQQVVCDGQCNGNCHHSSKGLEDATLPNRYVFTVNGTLEDGSNGWPQIVKVTVDQKGTILKMAVSK